jgi:hypothetical protein
MDYWNTLEEIFNTVQLQLLTVSIRLKGIYTPLSQQLED